MADGSRMAWCFVRFSSLSTARSVCRTPPFLQKAQSFFAIRDAEWTNFLDTDLQLAVVALGREGRHGHEL